MANGEQFIYTTLRYDPILLQSSENTKASLGQTLPLFMTEYHWRRLQEAADSLVERPQADVLYDYKAFVRLILTTVRERYENWPNECLRIGIKISESGKIETTILQAQPQRASLERLFPMRLSTSVGPDYVPWKVTLDDRATEMSEATWHKTSDRSMYDRARESAGIETFADPHEVLLYNTRGEIMDGSITTPYFYRNGVWVTPARVCGGQEGTTRRWAMARGVCTSGVVLKSSLKAGEVVWLSNGLRGFFPGIFNPTAEH